MSLFITVMVIWVLFHNAYDRDSEVAVQKMEVVMEIEKREGPAK